MDCVTVIEPCHDDDCSGLDEVTALLPNGRIWSIDRGGTYAGFVKALGHVKTDINQAICQVWNELDPCQSIALFDYWAALYKLPECVDQTQENLCLWIALLYDSSCPIGSLGFLNAAVDFVAPAAGITLTLNQDSFAGEWQGDSPCVDSNSLVVSAPAASFFYEEVSRDYPHEAQDGENACRTYFIPEIECLRYKVFPFGLSVGYQTDTANPNGSAIFNVPVANIAEKPQTFIDCGQECANI